MAQTKSNWNPLDTPPAIMGAVWNIPAPTIIPTMMATESQRVSSLCGRLWGGWAGDFDGDITTMAPRKQTVGIDTVSHGYTRTDYYPILVVSTREGFGQEGHHQRGGS